MAKRKTAKTTKPAAAPKMLTPEQIEALRADQQQRVAYEQLLRRRSIALGFPVDVNGVQIDAADLEKQLQRHGVLGTKTPQYIKADVLKAMGLDRLRDWGVRRGIRGAESMGRRQLEIVATEPPEIVRQPAGVPAVVAPPPYEPDRPVLPLEALYNSLWTDGETVYVINETDKGIFVLRPVRQQWPHAEKVHAAGQVAVAKLAQDETLRRVQKVRGQAPAKETKAPAKKAAAKVPVTKATKSKKAAK